MSGLWATCACDQFSVEYLQISFLILSHPSYLQVSFLMGSMPKLLGPVINFCQSFGPGSRSALAAIEVNVSSESLRQRTEAMEKKEIKIFIEIVVGNISSIYSSTVVVI